MSEMTLAENTELDQKAPVEISKQTDEVRIALKDMNVAEAAVKGTPGEELFQSVKERFGHFVVKYVTMSDKSAVAIWAEMGDEDVRFKAFEDFDEANKWWPSFDLRPKTWAAPEDEE